MFCCAVCDKKGAADLHPGGHIYSVPEETIPGDFVWYDDNRKTIDWHTCLLWVFLKICLSSLIRLPGHLAAHNSRSCGSGVHLKMGGVRIGLGGRWLIGDVLLNVPPSLFADAVEDCEAGGRRELQPSGRGRGAQSEIHGDNQMNYSPWSSGFEPRKGVCPHFALEGLRRPCRNRWLFQPAVMSIKIFCDRKVFLPWTHRICPFLHQKFCRSGQASQRGQEGCRSGQGRWSRQSPRRGSNTESNRYRSSTNTESNTNADAANMQYTSENRIVADSNISEVALPYFRFSATVFGNIWWISFSDLNARKSQKNKLGNLFFCFLKSTSLVRRARDRIWRALTAFLMIQEGWTLALTDDGTLSKGQ